jgi:hypothetical protein
MVSTFEAHGTPQKVHGQRFSRLEGPLTRFGEDAEPSRRAATGSSASQRSTSAANSSAVPYRCYGWSAMALRQIESSAGGTSASAQRISDNLSSLWPAPAITSVSGTASARDRPLCVRQTENGHDAQGTGRSRGGYLGTVRLPARASDRPFPLLLLSLAASPNIEPDSLPRLPRPGRAWSGTTEPYDWRDNHAFRPPETASRAPRTGHP